MLWINKKSERINCRDRWDRPIIKSMRSTARRLRRSKNSVLLNTFDNDYIVCVISTQSFTIKEIAKGGWAITKCLSREHKSSFFKRPFNQLRRNSSSQNKRSLRSIRYLMASSSFSFVRRSIRATRKNFYQSMKEIWFKHREKST